MRLLYEPGRAGPPPARYDWRRWSAGSQRLARGERMMAAKHAWFAALLRAPARRVPPPRRDEPRPSGRAGLGVHPPSARPGSVASAEGRGRYDDLVPAAGLARVPRRLGGRRTTSTSCGPTSATATTQHACGPPRLVDEASRRPLPTRRPSTGPARRTSTTSPPFAMSGTKTPYLRELDAARAAPARRLLDYGCGIGSDGLRLQRLGYRVDFADFDNPSDAYLRWRLERRGVDAPVHDVEQRRAGRLRPRLLLRRHRARRRPVRLPRRARAARGSSCS